MSVAGSIVVNWNRRETRSPGLADWVQMARLSDRDFFCFLLASFSMLIARPSCSLLDFACLEMPFCYLFIYFSSVHSSRFHKAWVSEWQWRYSQLLVSDSVNSLEPCFTFHLISFCTQYRPRLPPS